jgi:tRNA threonylcarbamoyladenosine biosynthesis protein TsaE
VTTTLTTHSEGETADIGRRLARRLAVGSVILLSGDLGAGKTAFVRGLAEGLGVDPAEVSSPTFTLIQEYRGGRIPLWHVDLYRLNEAREIDDLGIEELSLGGAVAIEWGERLPGTFLEGARVRIDHVGETERLVTVDTED